MASSDLWGNIILTKSILATDGTSMCLTHLCQMRGNLAPPGGWKDHTYQCEECVCNPHMYHGEGWAHYRLVEDYLRWRAGESYRTSSLVWGSWYFPRFLFRDGVLTLMSMASLRVLVTPCAPWPSLEKLSTLMQCPVDYAVSWVRGPWKVP